MKTLVDRFPVQSDDGRRFVMHEYQEQRRFTPLSGPSTVLKGSRSWELSDGTPVNQIDAETYQIVTTDLIVRKT